MNFLTPGTITVTAVRISTDIRRTILGYKFKHSYNIIPKIASTYLLYCKLLTILIYDRGGRLKTKKMNCRKST